jgi:hypothetical protein
VVSCNDGSITYIKVIAQILHIRQQSEVTFYMSSARAFYTFASLEIISQLKSPSTLFYMSNLASEGYRIFF